MKIILADDHTMLREGIRMVLKEAFPLAEINEVADAVDFLKVVNKEKWDVTISDIAMPPGDSELDAIKKIKEISPSTPVIIVTPNSADHYTVRAIKASASGYLSKDAASIELVKAMNHVLSGRKYLNGHVVARLADASESSNRTHSMYHPLNTLKSKFNKNRK